ncbi:MAG: nucleotidyltransferase family protein [Chloroflexi bacterium]|nr:nucleotidyltransferase family protein [Chloroflexota bacterium]
MKAVVLAAGEGTRLRPLTLQRPKPMLPIGGTPLLEHTLRWLHNHGVDEVALNLHHLPQMVMDHFGDGRRWDLRLRYSVEEELLGTAGALTRFPDFFDDEPFFLVYGDLLTAVDLGEMRRFHGERGAAATVALYRVPNPTECGLVDLDEQGRIRRFVEKPPPHEVFTDLANAGIYVLEPRLVQSLEPGQFCDFGRHVFPRLLAAGELLLGYPIHNYLLDMGTLAKYQQAQDDWAAGRVR